MNLTELLPLPARLAAGALLLVASAGAALAYRASLIDDGRALERTERALVDATNATAAATALAAANAEIARRQTTLEAAEAALATKELEFHDQQARSTALQSDLAAGRQRLRVAASCAPAAPARQGDAAAAAGLDPRGEPPAATLAPGVASDLEWARQTRNDALSALGACVVLYDAAAKATAD